MVCSVALVVAVVSAPDDGLPPPQTGDPHPRSHHCPAENKHLKDIKHMNMISL